MLKVIFVISCLLLAPWSSDAAVRTGAQVLDERGYDLLAGKRVGLITNHTALVGGVHVAEAMKKSGVVQLSALFSPEHGLNGKAEDGVAVGEGTDDRTETRVFSLYGATKKPTQEMLRDLDIVVFDIQDIGSRFYTYISTMGLAMQAAAEARIPFIVLDRPNPLGGNYVAGFLLEPQFVSFEGLFRIPVAHGLTIGELAILIKEEAMLPGLDDLDLRVVKMDGWRREMQWPDTGLPWVSTSPNIPDFETALLYPGICFFEATSASEGRGTKEPFKVVGMPNLNAEKVAEMLNAAKLPGVKFQPLSYVPVSIPGMTSNPKYKNQIVNGVRLVITDQKAFLPVETGIYLLSFLFQAGGGEVTALSYKPAGLARLAGTDLLQWALDRGAPPQDLISGWSRDVQGFLSKRQDYLLYE